MPLDLTKLSNDQPVKYRTSRRDNADGTNPEWGDWKLGTLFLSRRDKDYRTRGRIHPAGEILTLTINRAGWASYGEVDYNPEFNEWLAEDYRLQFVTQF